MTGIFRLDGQGNFYDNRISVNWDEQHELTRDAVCKRCGASPLTFHSNMRCIARTIKKYDLWGQRAS